MQSVKQCVEQRSVTARRAPPLSRNSQRSPLRGTTSSLMLDGCRIVHNISAREVTLMACARGASIAASNSFSRPAVFNATRSRSSQAHRETEQHDVRWPSSGMEEAWLVVTLQGVPASFCPGSTSCTRPPATALAELRYTQDG